MEKFDLGNGYVASCSYANGLSRFYHTCVLYKGGKRIGTYKAEYWNRTWEAYTYQRAMKLAVENSKHLTEAEKEALTEALKNEPSKVR